MSSEALAIFAAFLSMLAVGFTAWASWRIAHYARETHFSTKQFYEWTKKQRDPDPIDVDLQASLREEFSDSSGERFRAVQFSLRLANPGDIPIFPELLHISSNEPEFEYTSDYVPRGRAIPASGAAHADFEHSLPVKVAEVLRLRPQTYVDVLLWFL